MSAHDATVILPIRSFADAKSRLTSVLSPADRERLVRAMAERVVHAAHHLPVLVVSDDPDVAIWADARGLEALAPGVAGLNPSVSAARDCLAQRPNHPKRVIVAHCDLPRARDLRIVTGPGVAIAPDRHRDGSNVLSVPLDADFSFHYGPGSFSAHCHEAQRLNLPVTVIDDPELAFDVDHPADLHELGEQDDRS